MPKWRWAKGHRKLDTGAASQLQLGPVTDAGFQPPKYLSSWIRSSTEPIKPLAASNVNVKSITEYVCNGRCQLAGSNSYPASRGRPASVSDVLSSVSQEAQVCSDDIGVRLYKEARSVDVRRNPEDQTIFGVQRLIGTDIIEKSESVPRQTKAQLKKRTKKLFRRQIMESQHSADSSFGDVATSEKLEIAGGPETATLDGASVQSFDSETTYVKDNNEKALDKPDSITGHSTEMWAQALASLDPEERLILGQNKVDRNASFTIDNLVSLVRQQQSEFQGRRRILTYSSSQRTVNLTRLMDGIVTWAERFKGIGDIIVQFQPSYMALPWAAARLLLQMLIDDRTNIATILTTVERVINVTAMCTIYTGMYLNENIISDPTQDRFKASLVETYKAILSSLARTIKYLGRRTLADRTFFHNEDLDAGLKNIDRQLQGVRDAVNIAETEVNQSNNVWQKDVYARFKVLLEGLGQSLKKLQRTNEELIQDINIQRRSELLMWISNSAYRKYHDEAVSGDTILSNTGEWLFSMDEYQEWSAGTEAASIFWLHDKPGVGKTYLTHAAIELAKDSINSGDRDPFPVIYFYCSRRDNKQSLRDPVVIFRTLLKALLIETDIEPAAIGLDERYQERTERGELGLEEAQKALIKLLNRKEGCGTRIFLDGLDEVEEHQRRPLLRGLAEICATTTTRLWIASRPEQDIRNALFVSLAKRLQQPNSKLVQEVAVGEHNEKELRAYIQREIEDKIDDGSLLDGEVETPLKNLMIEKLSEKGDGMYLWVRLQILNLSQQKHINHVHEQLENLERLPKGLDATYQQMYDAILNEENEIDKSNAKDALRWLLCATGPLRTDEWIQLVQLSAACPSTIDALYLRKICRNLVRMDETHVNFIHLSVRDFLERQSDLVESKPPHFMAAMACLKHLIVGDKAPNKPLLPYVVKGWPTHCAKALQDPIHTSQIMATAKTFLQSQPSHQNWLNHATKEGVDITGFSPLFTVSQFGLALFCTDILRNPDAYSVVLSQLTSEGQTPLHVSIRFGHLDCVRAFLSEGSTEIIDYKLRRDTYGRTPFAVAIIYRQHDVAKYLKTIGGMDLNGKDGLGGYHPLVRAAWLNDMEMVEILLQNGGHKLDIEATNDIGHTALHWAIQRVNNEMVRVLIAAGANLNASDEKGELPITDAIWELVFQWCTEEKCPQVFQCSHLEAASVFEQLYSNSQIDLNLCCRDLTPLAYAIDLYDWISTNNEGTARENRLQGLQEVIVRLLGVDSLDVNFLMPNGWTALQFAIARRLPEVVKTLLKEAPRINASLVSVREDSSALHMAVDQLCYSSVDSLLASGSVDAKCEDWQGKTPLVKAILDCRRPGETNNAIRQSIVKRLLVANNIAEAQIDKLITTEESAESVREDFEYVNGWSILQDAARVGHAAVLELFGGKVSIPPLTTEHQLAFQRMHQVFSAALRVVERPTASHSFAKLDVNVTAANGWSALHYAASSKAREEYSARQCHQAIEVLLSQESINPNQLDVYGRTPLLLASLHDVEIVRQLLALPNTEPNGSRRPEHRQHTPLGCAVKNGHLDVVRALIADERVDVNCQDEEGLPLLNQAVSAHKTASCGKVLLSLLQSSRVDVNCQDPFSGQTPLAVAVCIGNLDALKLLLDTPGVDTELKDHSWNTPLGSAAAKGRIDLVNALLAKKANRNWKNWKGQTPADLAYDRRYTAIWRVLNNAV